MGKILIPDKYSKEFEDQTIRLFRSRIRMFLILIITFFAAGVLLSYPYTPQDLSPLEIPFDIAVPLAASVIYLLSGRTRSLKLLKLYAYFMNAAILLAGTAFYLIYPEIFYVGISSYLMLLLLISMSMPWNKREIIFVTLTAALLFTGVAYVSHTPYLKQAYFIETNLFIFLFAGFVATIFKHHDEKRRREQFILKKELEEKKQAIERDLEMARQVHRSLIPKSFSNDLVDIAVSYIPYSYVGGDYAKFNFVSPHELLILIMDITGHGVPAALLVNRLHSEVSSLSREIRQPQELLRRLERFVHEVFEGTQMFLSAYACLIDFKSSTLCYSNFGHPPQVLYLSKKHEIRYMTPQRQWVGVESRKTAGIHEASLDFEKGDQILLFTDGLLEVKGRDGNFFGKNGLEDFIQRNQSLVSESFNQKLVEDLNRLNSESSFADDVFILNIQIKK